MKKVNVIIFHLIISLTAFAQSPLLIPDYISGSEVQLTLQEGEVELFQGHLTKSIGYNQNILGPTLIFDKGQDVSIDVVNKLNEPTTVHWHGLHVSPKNDGGPHTIINPDHTWSPEFTILDEAATYWYHPHLHEHTEEQVTNGAAGFIIVRDADEAELELPRTYGVDDIPIVIQSRAFDSDNQFMTNTAADNIILCNATIDAFLDAPAQVVRLRLLNGSTERLYNLGFSDDRNFFQIASDGGLLNEPVSMNRLVLVPGERAEILLDLSGDLGKSLTLISYGSELPNGYYGASNPSVMPMGNIEGYSSNNLNGNDFEVLDINVISPSEDAVLSIPGTLVNHIPYSEDDVDRTRSLVFSPGQMGPHGMVNGPFSINNQSFDLNVINEEVLFENTEIWELRNMTAIAHPFHIHDVQFYILDINGSIPSASMRGRKDVVIVPPMGGTVRIIMRFDDFANIETPYMYHCHMLSHEDDGMMGQFLVLPLTTNEINLDPSIVTCSPNPATNFMRITGAPQANLKIYDIRGNMVRDESRIREGQEININNLEQGIYILTIESDKFKNSLKLMKL